jgi:hypothetical protein
MLVAAIRFLVAALLFSAPALAAGLPAANLPNHDAADAFARKIVAHYQAEAKAQGVMTSELDPIVILHVGNQLPAQVKWVMLHLESAKIPVKLEVVKQDELEAELDKARDKATDRSVYLTYDPDEKYASPDYEQRRLKGVSAAWKSSKDFLKRLFGLPNGFTLWTKLDRSRRLKWIEGGMATLSSLMSGASVAYTFYLTEQIDPVGANALRAGLALAAWSWFYGYESRRVTDFMLQAKVIRQTGSHEYTATNNKVFTHVATTLRSLLTNAVIMSGAFGVDSAFSEFNFEHNVWNTTVNIFARGWIDDWLGARMPTIREDGTILVDRAKGQWKLGTWIAVNQVWNVVYGIGKYANLLGLGNIADIPYYLLGAVGVAKMIWDKRWDIKDLAQRAINAFKGAKVELCESILVGPKRKVTRLEPAWSVERLRLIAAAGVGNRSVAARRFRGVAAAHAAVA